jgi:two-component system cell cycle sensor histidine kinase/response regulator CckA
MIYFTSGGIQVGLPGVIINLVNMEMAEKNGSELHKSLWELQVELERSHAEARELKERLKKAEEKLSLRDEIIIASRGEFEKKVEERTRSLSVANESARASEARLRAFMEATGDLVWEVDAGGIYTYAGAKIRDLLGYEPGEMPGKSFFDFIAPGEKEKSRQEFLRAAGLREPLRLPENRLLRKDGGISVFETNASPVIDPEGRLLGYMGISRDIAARKAVALETDRMHRQLIQSQRMECVGLLAGGIAHDFNNLMVIIKLNSNLALEKANAECTGYIRQISRASERAEALTRQLLVYSRRLPSEVRALNLNQVVLETLNLLNRLIGENIRIKTELAPAVRSVMADKLRIEQMIMNLVLNAKDAMDGGGVIKIRTESLDAASLKGDIRARHKPEAGHYVRLSVKDSGTGMDGETACHIFEPFFTTKGEGASGLGLPAVQSVMKDLKGWIDVDTRPGSGTCFDLYFPATGQSEEARDLEDRSAPAGAGERILLVEAELLLRKSVAMVLSKSGYTVLEAAGAKEALDVFRSEMGRFDLVMIDMVLEDNRGLELVEELNAAKGGQVNVLIMSGDLDAGSQWPEISKYGYVILRKPYEASDLLRSVSDAFRAGRRRNRKKTP